MSDSQAPERVVHAALDCRASTACFGRQTSARRGDHPGHAVTGGVKPADPSADGFEFGGWYTNAQLTTLADFSAPLSASATFYAKWQPTLAATGGEPNPAAGAAAIAA